MLKYLPDEDPVGLNVASVNRLSEAVNHDVGFSSWTFFHGVTMNATLTLSRYCSLDQCEST